MMTLEQAAYVLSQEGEENVNFNKLLFLLAAFRTNNFGIVDDLFTVVASGVYPSTAILNHSCLPNTVLVYERGRAGTAPIVHGISLGSSGGEELTHSYCDTTKPLALRRQHLQQTHGFFCTCFRCTEQAEAATAAWTEDEERLSKSLSNAASRPLELRALLPQLCSSSSSVIRQHALVERLSTDKNSPFEYGRYQTKCRALEEALIDGNVEAAVAACEQVVCSLALFFSHLDFHPLLGLQLFTLGDLYRACEGREQEAAPIYAWCKEVLSYTHARIGSDLLQKLEESSSSD
jgi:SET and MYND domain-containing protein